MLGNGLMKMTPDSPHAHAAGEEYQGSNNQAPSHPMQDNGGNAITDALGTCQGLLQAYGWYLVLAVVAMYLLLPSLLKLRAELSLRHANNPTRRKILDEERKRVRLQQQVDLLRAKEKAEEEKALSAVTRSQTEDVENECESTSPTSPLPPAATGSTLRKRAVVPKKKPKEPVAPSS